MHGANETEVGCYTEYMAELGENFTFTRPDFGKNPLQFFKEVRTELSKVSWPNRQTVLKLTIVVIGVSVAVGIYLGGLDVIFAKAVETLLARK